MQEGKMNIYKDQELKTIKDLMLGIKEESERQIRKWGVQERSLFEWFIYTSEELGELAKAISEFEYRGGSKIDIINEAIQTATLCLKIAEMVDEGKREK